MQAMCMEFSVGRINVYEIFIMPTSLTDIRFNSLKYLKYFISLIAHRLLLAIDRIKKRVMTDQKMGVWHSPNFVDTQI